MSILPDAIEMGEAKSPSYRTLLPPKYLESLNTLRDTLGFEAGLRQSVSTSPSQKIEQLGNTTISATSFSTFR
jgi:hypothetical protein